MPASHHRHFYSSQRLLLRVSLQGCSGQVTLTSQGLLADAQFCTDLALGHFKALVTVTKQLQHRHTMTTNSVWNIERQNSGDSIDCCIMSTICHPNYCYRYTMSWGTCRSYRIRWSRRLLLPGQSARRGRMLSACLSRLLRTRCAHSAQAPRAHHAGPGIHGCAAWDGSCWQLVF